MQTAVNVFELDPLNILDGVNALPQINSQFLFTFVSFTQNTTPQNPRDVS